MSNVQNFTVYSKSGCPYCSKIVEVLDHIKASYTVYSLGEHFDKDSFYGEFGNGTTFPQILLNGKKLGGCVDTIKYLKEEQIVWFEENKGVELILGGTKPKSQNIKPFGIRFKKMFSLFKKDIHFNFEFSFTIKNKKI